MRDRNLAHFNWGTLRAAPNDPLVADFVAGIDMVDRGPSNLRALFGNIPASEQRLARSAGRCSCITPI